MKKLILSLLVLASFTITSTYAQKANVNKAKSKATSENPNFNEARELIKPALIDATTKNEANTWYVAGLIGYNEKRNIDEKNSSPATIEEKNDLAALKAKAALESYNYLLIADSLDQLPNEKGKVKPKYRRNIKDIIREYPGNFIEYGASLFDNKQYSEAYTYFNKFVELVDLPLMENEIPKDSTYKMIKYFAAIAATQADLGNEAIVLYETLKNENYETLTVYQLLAEEYGKIILDEANIEKSLLEEARRNPSKYGKMKNEKMFEQTLMEGSQLFPQDAWFIQKLINYYIDNQENQKALTYLNSAIEKNPKSAEYRFVEGGLKESLGDIDGAIQSYIKATEIDPKMGAAYAELGRIHYNKAITIGEEIDITDRKKAKEEEEKAIVEFKKALTNFEKASKINPEENSYKYRLRNLYYRLRMDKEYDAINKEIEQQEKSR